MRGISRGLLLAQPLEILADVFFEAVVGWIIEGDVAEFFGKEALADVAFFTFVAVAVAFAVAHLFHR